MRVSGTNWPPYLPKRPRLSGTSRWIGGVRVMGSDGGINDRLFASIFLGGKSLFGHRGRLGRRFTQTRKPEVITVFYATN